MTFKIKDGILIAGSTFVDSSTNVTAASINVGGNVINTSSNYGSGSLQVSGGINVVGVVTATNIYMGIWPVNTSSVATSLQNTSTTQVGYATTAGFAVSFNTGTLVTSAVNLVGGSANQIPFQNTNNITGFSANLTYDGTTLTSGQIKAAGTAGSASTATGALQVVGGIGVGGGIYAGGVVTATNVYVGIWPVSTSSVATSLANTATTQVGYATTAGYAVSFNTSTLVSLAVNIVNTSTTLVAQAVNLVNTSTTYVSHAALADSATTATSAATAYSWLGGTVSNPVTFSGPVTFNGTSTNVFSTNTYYTDNLIEVHVPPTGVYGSWTLDDGKDIGFRFHYYNGADQNAALVLADDSKYLEWYSAGAESASGVFTGTIVYGTFKTGSIILTTATGTTSAGTGALQVAGGVGIGGGLYVGGTVTATTFVGSFSGSVTGAASQVQTQAQTANATYYPTFVNANNFSAAAESLYTTSSFSINPATGYVGIGTASPTAKLTVLGGATFSNDVTVTGGSLQVRAGIPLYWWDSTTSNYYYASNTGSAGTNTAILSFIQGGYGERMRIDSSGNVGIGTSSPGQKLVVSGAIKVTGAATLGTTNGTTGAEIEYVYPTTRMYIGDGTGWDFRIAKRNASVTTDIVTFTDTGSVSFNGSYGSSGQILQSNGNTSPTWISTSTAQIGYAANLLGGTTNQVPYQTNANATGFQLILPMTARH
jgi:hypothetical protein